LKFFGVQQPWRNLMPAGYTLFTSHVNCNQNCHLIPHLKFMRVVDSFWLFRYRY